MEYKYKKILRQSSILAVNFWSVTYFGTSYLGAKIDQNKTMTNISDLWYLKPTRLKINRGHLKALKVCDIKFV